MLPYEAIQRLKTRVETEVLGRKEIIERFMIGLLADGNILVEGLPGLGKTRLVRTIAQNLDAHFSRIQFTPDLSVAEIIGEERLYLEEGKRVFRFRKGPIFGNIVLADEINRAPAKVQSAMLEAMEERQVTVAGKTIPLPRPFMVMATQNPIEQEGTFPLSEAQKDRFLMHVHIDYIDMESEYEMLQLLRKERRHPPEIGEKIPASVILEAQREVNDVRVDEAIGRYIVELVFATRYPLRYSRQLEVMIDIGVSPRGTIALQKCAQARAWLHGKDAVRLEDIHTMIHDVFRHRLIISQHAVMNNRTVDETVDAILKQVPLPEAIDPLEKEAAKRRIENL